MFTIKMCSRVLGLLLVAGCSGGEQDELPVEDRGEGDGWSMLVSGDWQLAAGTEEYQCARATMTEDTYISSLKSVGPLGTHHTVLTVGEPNGPDGLFPCSGQSNETTMIFGSGIGDTEFTLPEGVGVKIAAGQQLNLNLHLFNVADAPLSGTSGTLAKFVSADKIIHEAEVVLAGTVSLDIPPGESTSVGTCTLEQDVTVLTIGPHMHELGKHMKVLAIRGGEEFIVHDKGYDFTDQKNYDVEDFQMGAGDKLQVSCTYDNPTMETRHFGDSSTQEMCFASFFRYPRREQSFTGVACIF